MQLDDIVVKVLEGLIGFGGVEVLASSLAEGNGSAMRLSLVLAQKER